MNFKSFTFSTSARTRVLLLACLTFSGTYLSSCTQEAGQEKSTSAAGDSVTTPAPKPKATGSVDDIPKGATVWVNADTLLKHYDWYQQQRNALESKGKKAEKELTGRMQSFENEVMSARGQMQSPSMTQDKAQSMERALMQKQQGLQAYKEEQSKLLMEEEQRVAKTLTKTMRNFFKAYAKEHGFSYVMSYTEPGTVLFADEKLDVTADVIEQINKQPAPALEPLK